MTSAFCTIVTRNDLPQARVLAASLADHHPDAHLTVLVVDGDALGGRPLDQEPFKTMTLLDLPGDQIELRRMALMYDLGELSTALKPWLLTTLLHHGTGTAIYLDPDVRVFAPLDELRDLAEHHEVVLTPHVTAPLPRDGKGITEGQVLASGIFNLGFVAVGPRSGRFLGFWRERLQRECLIDPPGTSILGQRWVDFAPGVFDTAIVRDPGCNVAYWNLDHRDLRWNGRSYEVDGRPLRFFHFSGYHPGAPHLLSTHQGAAPSILLSERHSVRQICHEYGEQLEKAGWSAGRHLPYGLGTTPTGIDINGHIRLMARQAVRLADQGKGPYPPDPWGPDGDDEFVAWLHMAHGPPETAGRLTRFLASIHAIRPDLQAAFPDPEGADYERLLVWFREEIALGRMPARMGPGGTEELGTAARSLPGRDAAHTWRPHDQLDPGFLVTGYLNAELGVGEAARLATTALDAAGLPYEAFAVTSTLSRQNYPFTTNQDYDGRFDINLLCINADQLPGFAKIMGPGFFEGRHTIGLWSWELEDFPSIWDGSLDLVDEIWGISQFTCDAISKITDVPVFASSPPIVAPTVPDGIGRAQLGLPDDRFIFLFCFDFFSIPERKNPCGVVEAFIRAFPSGPSGPSAKTSRAGTSGAGPLLVVKSINGAMNVPELERLRYAAADRDDIVVIDRYFDVGRQGALMAAADCYVSLHRSEGFGLTMAEAMALGKPVIATGYSANLEFMDEETALLVPWTAGAVPPGCDPYPVGARWAEPDIPAAAELMRRVSNEPDEARAMGARAQKAVEERHGPAARAGFYRERYRAIEAARLASLSG